MKQVRLYGLKVDPKEANKNKEAIPETREKLILREEIRDNNKNRRQASIFAAVEGGRKAAQVLAKFILIEEKREEEKRKVMPKIGGNYINFVKDYAKRKNIPFKKQAKTKMNSQNFCKQRRQKALFGQCLNFLAAASREVSAADRESKELGATAFRQI